jgi:hypothetical protein
MKIRRLGGTRLQLVPETPLVGALGIWMVIGGHATSRRCLAFIMLRHDRLFTKNSVVNLIRKDILKSNFLREVVL